MPKQDTQASPTRRQYSTAFKRDLVERCLQPGASVSGIALDNGINANVLFRWRREQLHAAPSVRQELVEPAVLLPVKLADPVTATGMEAPLARTRAPGGVIEIDIGAARVRLRGSVDEANLRCVLHTLKASA